jgi:hypothetical protein
MMSTAANTISVLRQHNDHHRTGPLPLSRATMRGNLARELRGLHDDMKGCELLSRPLPDP